MSPVQAFVACTIRPHLRKAQHKITAALDSNAMTHKLKVGQEMPIISISCNMFALPKEQNHSNVRIREWKNMKKLQFHHVKGSSESVVFTFLPACKPWPFRWGPNHSPVYVDPFGYLAQQITLGTLALSKSDLVISMVQISWFLFQRSEKERDRRRWKSSRKN